MATWKVKKVTKGVGEGEWGVYKDGVLQVTYKQKASATTEKRRREREGNK